MRLCALLVATGIATAALATRDAAAVGTRTFELDTLEKLSGGDLQGVTIGSDGVVRAGWTLGNAALPPDSGTTAPCALALGDGSVLVGTGPASGGKIVRIVNDEATVYADTRESAVNALAVDHAGVVYAATTSNRIYRIAAGKVDVYATLAGVDSVLSLAIDRSGALFAGTGSAGTIVRVEPGGTSNVYYTTEDPFVVALATGDDGALYAGTSGKGLVYRVSGPGRAEVLYDPPGEDVRALATGPDHSLFAVVNEEPPTSQVDEHEASSRRTTGGRAAPGPGTAPRSKPGKGSLWRFDAQGRPERMMHHDEFHYVSLAVDSRGIAYVGTGAEGRVYSVDDAHEVALVADTPERQVNAMSLSGRSWFLVGSDPAVFHRILALGGPESVWTSKPLDAGLRARFGHLRWRSTGSVELSTRSGNTSTPDSTWSSWSAPVAVGTSPTSPVARFVQMRARLRDAASTLSDPVLPFVTENLRAVVTDVGTRDRPGHETKDAVPSSGSEPPRHDSVVHLVWKIDNPDNDELRYRLQFRREGQSRWIDALPRDLVLTKPEFDWDTATLPEGVYRVRVDASDELANPPASVTRHALESAPLLVDNTPPVFRTLAVQKRRLRGDVVDGLGPIARIELAVDGRTEWAPVSSVDGIFDMADESIDVDLGPFLGAEPGPHLLAVRAFDAAGNSVVRDVEVP
jgi:hypothetical protein